MSERLFSRNVAGEKFELVYPVPDGGMASLDEAGLVCHLSV